MARIIGRQVLASNLSERRVLQTIGMHSLRVPRGMNPYLVARRLRRAAKPDDDVTFLAAIAQRVKKSSTPPAAPAAAALEPTPEAA